MGYAFTYPIVHFLTRTNIAAYVHYPTIRYIQSLHGDFAFITKEEIYTVSSDMLQRVYERRAQYNNDAKLAQSTVWTYGKLMFDHGMHLRFYCRAAHSVVLVITISLPEFTDGADHLQKPFLWIQRGPRVTLIVFGTPMPRSFILHVIQNDSTNSGWRAVDQSLLA